MEILEPKMIDAYTLREEGVAASAMASQKVNVSDSYQIWVVWTVTNATNKNDIGDAEAHIVLPSGLVTDVILPADSVVERDYSAGLATHAHKYEVTAFNTLELRLQNGANAPRDLEIHVFKGQF